MSPYLQPETTETIAGDNPSTVSGNDTGNSTVDNGNIENSGGGQETGGTGEVTGGLEGETGSPHETPGTPSPSGGVDTLPDPSASEQFMNSVLGSLDVIGGKLDSDPSLDNLSDSLRSLVDLMTLQAEEEARKTEEAEYVPASIPLADYDSYAYPVSVAYLLYPSGLGSETDTVETYATAEDFQNGYTAMRNSMQDGALSWFSILSVDDCSGERVYDAATLLSAEEEGLTEDEELIEDEELTEDEEPDTFREDVLAALDALHEDLQTVSGNDLGYYDGSLSLGQSVLDLQEQCLELQQENMQLSYHMLACDIGFGFVLLLALGYIIMSGFFKRMKAG